MDTRFDLCYIAPVPVSNPYAPPLADVDTVSASPWTASNLELATPGDRFKAALVDGVLLLVSAALFGMFVRLRATDLRAATFHQQLSMLPLWVVQWALITWRGQSIGKILCKLQICTTNGKPVHFLRGVLLRVWVLQGAAWMGGALLVALLPRVRFENAFALTNLIGVIDVLFIFGTSWRCLHDRIADTIVVKWAGPNPRPIAEVAP